jgi:hypothetical protein
MGKKEIDYKLATAKMFTLHDPSELHCIAIASDEMFGKADTILVSTDKKTWIQHSYSDFMDAVNNQTPIKVG